jgi:WhiB family redox-sensing transcriptional regulator
MTLPCVVGPADLWFSRDPEEVDVARVRCARCPVRRDCLLGALERREECGVWGGELFLGGRPVPGPARNGRPAKNAEMVEREQRARMVRRIEAVLQSA